MNSDSRELKNHTSYISKSVEKLRYQADVFHPVDYSRSSDVSEMWRKHLHVITSPHETHDSYGRDLIVMPGPGIMSPPLMYSPAGDTNISHLNL